MKREKYEMKGDKQVSRKDGKGEEERRGLYREERK